MSAIFGCWRLDGSGVTPLELDGMSRALAFRGHDGDGRWISDSVGLGCRHFRSVPGEVASRPENWPVAISSEGDVVLVADARVDNRGELFDLIGWGGRERDQVDDALLLLELYRRFYERLPERVLGDFAVAVWDRKRAELFLTRDHFGVRPLYYHFAPGRLFAFASGIAGLHALDDVPTEIDELRVAEHLLVPVPEDSARTPFEQVKRLLPGHSLAIRADGNVRSRRYWSLDPTRRLELRSCEEYAEAVKAAFEQAVRVRLRADVPVAAMLSGGIDSSSIACVAARELAESHPESDVLALSAVYPDAPASDERLYIDAVLRAYPFTSILYTADRASPIAELEAMHPYTDGPVWGGNAYLSWNLFGSAAAHGARVVLDGFDGDTTLSHGLARLTELAIANRWWELAREVRANSVRQGQPWVGPYRHWVVRFGIRRTVQSFRSNGADGEAPSWLPYERTRSREWTRSLAPDFAKRLAERIERRPRRIATSEREDHARRLSQDLLYQGLGCLEALGAGAGVEVRFPFFDLRLVETCFALPADQKLMNGWTRYAMRNAMRGVLPESVRTRPTKADLTPGLNHALRQNARCEIGVLLRESEDVASRFLDHGRLSETVASFMAGRTTAQQDVLLFRMLSLSLWLTRSHGVSTAGAAHDPWTDDRHIRKEV